MGCGSSSATKMEAVDRQQRGWPLSPQKFTLSFDLGERKREGSGDSPVAPESAAEAYYGSSGQETEELACSYPSATGKSWPINNRKNGPKMPINHAAFSSSSGDREGGVLKISSSRLGILQKDFLGSGHQETEGLLPCRKK
jgi:hypothetical protein